MKIDDFDVFNVDDVKVQLALSFLTLLNNLSENIIE